MQAVFQPEELGNRNCSGTRGKELLDQIKLGVVKNMFLSCTLVCKHNKLRNGLSASSQSTSFCVGGEDQRVVLDNNKFRRLRGWSFRKFERLIVL